MNWIGILIGALSTLFIFPNALEEYGFMRFILDTSSLLFPLLSLGVNSITIRFFPYFEDKTARHNGFLGFLLLWGGVSYCVVLCIALLFREPLLAYYGAKNTLFQSFLWLLVPSSFFLTLNNILYQYSINFKRIVIPSILMDVSQKIILPLLIISYLQGWIELGVLLWILVGYLALVSVSFVVYIVSLKAWFLMPNWAIFTPALRSEIRAYASYGLFGGVGFLLISRLDTWLVSTLLSLKTNGIYSISSFIANVMEVPSRALMGLGVPLLAQYWKDNNIQEIKILYQKASINLLILGFLLFGVFWVSVDAFFFVIANGAEMVTGKYVIFILCIGRLVDMATGLNNHILSYSAHFRYSYLQIILPAIFSVGLGLWLTPLYGMTGAAIATLCSIVFYNSISILLNWIFFKIQPFGFHTLKVVLCAISVFFIANMIPFEQEQWLLWAVLRSSFFALAFIFLIWKLNISPDLNNAINKILKIKI